MAFIPLIHKFKIASGGTLPGTAANTVPVPSREGRILSYPESAEGGLVMAVGAHYLETNGLSLKTMVWDGAGTTSLKVELVDHEGDLSEIYSVSTGSPKVYWQPERPIEIPPGFGLKVSTAGALAAQGRLILMFGSCWAGY